MNTNNRNAFHPDAILSTLENMKAIDWNAFDVPLQVKPNEVICLPNKDYSPEVDHAASAA